MDGVLVLTGHRLWALDEHLNEIGQTRLANTAGEAAASLQRILEGERDAVLEQFIGSLSEKGVDRLLVESHQWAEELNRLYGVKALAYEDVALWRTIRSRVLEPSIRPDERSLLREVALLVSRKQIREASERKDQLIVQAMGALDDVEKALNLVASRLREWYALHYPEATQRMDNALHLAQLVAQGGQREAIQANPDLLQLLPKEATKSLATGQSMGAEIGQYDMTMIQALAQQYLDLQRLRNQLEQYLDNSMREVAPNVRGLIGPVVGARLIALAGSIEKLARLPASTIQVLGAERALFRSLKTGARPPKHGVIFQHTSVHSAPWWQRGKIARILAGKIAIAARIDEYSGEYVAEELKQSITARIEEVKRKYPSGPKAEPAKPSHRLRPERPQRRGPPKRPPFQPSWKASRPQRKRRE
jgi:nucleolar protein 56